VSTYVSLLRGINVGGRAKVAMADLRELYAGLGFSDVTTYIQSGNVIFTSGLPARDIPARIEKGIQERLAMTVRVMVRTPKELAKIVDANPFPEVDVSRLYVAFLTEAPKAAGVDRLSAFDAGREEFRVAGRQIYLHFPDGAGRARLPVERAVGVATTVRNWRTVNKLIELSAAL
jgi:uncharacterized protein (DUF1697 family)